MNASKKQYHQRWKQLSAVNITQKKIFNFTVTKGLKEYVLDVKEVGRDCTYYSEESKMLLTAINSN